MEFYGDPPMDINLRVTIEETLEEKLMDIILRMESKN